ncbi:MAG: cytochrome c, partial [Methylococcaceae bacterium]
QDFCSYSRRRNRRIARYATVSTTWKTDKKTSQDADIIKSSLLKVLLIYFGLLFVGVNPIIAVSDPGPNLGHKPDPGIVKSWNLSIFPDGTGLPEGSGSTAEGQKIYLNQCLSCHGENGQGDSAEELAGAHHSLTDDPPDKTIGTYWPYATTLFDFISRAMPMDAPGSLTSGQIYAVTAYLLYLNHIIEKDVVLDGKTLTNIKMPNRHGFIDMYAKKRRQQP